MNEIVQVKLDKEYCCTICAQLVCNSDTAIVDDDILELLKSFIQNIDTRALQGAHICATCIAKIKEAFKFKTFYKGKQCTGNVEIKQETDCHKNFVVCYICKTIVIDSASMSLVNSTYENVLSCLIPKKELEKLNNPQMCDSCQISMLNFQSIIQLLSEDDCNAIGNEALKTEIKGENKDMSENDENEFLLENVSVIELLKKEVKEEEDERIEEDTLVEDYQLKHEELDLKTDYEPGLFREGRLKHIPKSDSKTGFFNKVVIFKCGLCGFQAESTSYLIQHMIKHKTCDKIEILNEKSDEVTIYKCNICDFQTKYQRSLSRHKIVHKHFGEIKTFECYLCECQSKCKSDLKMHLPIHKRSTSMYKCNVCDFQTKHKNYIPQHMLIHKNSDEVEKCKEVIYKCIICDFQTQHKGSLYNHKIVHKNSDEMKLFKCNACEFVTKHRGSLIKHKSIHKNSVEVDLFKCNLCEYKSKFKYSLKSHMMIHKNSDEIELFKCNFCEYQTKYKNCLVRHMVRHKKSTQVRRK